MSLAQRVRDFRYSKGWGPDELASRASISRTALYQIESGKTELPRAGTLRRIALALEVSMESLLGHGEAGKAGQAAQAATAARRARTPSGWIPAEGGPLTMPGGRSAATFSSGDDARFAVETQDVAQPHTGDGLALAREHELSRKLHEVLASPLGEGVAQIVEESYRLLPLIRHSS
jgi:transcriptional regulator with XRE-family HTH domain